MLFEKIKQIFRQQKEQEPFEKHDPLIVSFTSHPARIKFVPQVLESLYAQTLQADRILLWLAKKSLYGTHSNTHFEIIKEHYAMISKDELEKRFQACMHESCFIPDDSRLCYELCTADLEQKIAVLTSKRFFGDPIEKVLPVQVRKVVTMFNRQMARDHAAGGEKKYVSRIRKALRKVPGIDAIAWKDITIQALIEHEAVLRANMWGAFNTYEDYKQMLCNWQHLLESHPNCRPVYHEKYKLFLEDMEKAFSCKHEI